MNCRHALLRALGKFAAEVMARVVIFAVVTLLVKFIVSPGTPPRVLFAIGGFLVVGVGRLPIAVMGIWLARRYSVLLGELANLESRVRTGEQVTRPAHLPGAAAEADGTIAGVRT